MVERILHAVDRLELFPADEIPTEDALLVREASHLGGRRRPRGQTATVIDSLCTSIPTSILDMGWYLRQSGDKSSSHVALALSGHRPS